MKFDIDLAIAEKGIAGINRLTVLSVRWGYT
jgi:hypothetical protein